jgi:hypothetical protein
MAVRLPTACVLLAALCGAGGLTPTALAKPPDLPIRMQLQCAPATPAEVPGEDDVHARAADVTALRTLSRCVLFSAHPLLALVPVEEWLGDDDAETILPKPTGYVLPPADDPRFNEPPTYPEKVPDKEPPKSNNVTCPYLREKIDRQQAAASPDPVAPGTVLENLERLEQAAHLYRKGEAYRRAGQTDDARWCYQMIHKLCAGSRYDHLAERKFKAIAGEQEQPASGAAGEEEDAPAPHDQKQSALDVEGQVAELLDRCDKAFRAGEDAEAEALARQALDLSPEKVAAHPRVYVLHVLSILRPGPAPKPAMLTCDDGPGPGVETGEALLRQYAEYFRHGLYEEAQICAFRALAHDPWNPNALAAVRLATRQQVGQIHLAEPAPCPWAGEPRTAMRPPELPPVEGGVSAALDRILAAAEPGSHRVLPEYSGGEIVFGCAEDDPAKCAAHTLPLQDLIDMFRSMACVEVEGFPLPKRGRCHLPLGGLFADLSWDRCGEHGSLSFGVGFSDPTPDLRAEQWEHNERVSRWIERHSSGQAGAACTCDEEESEQP